MNPLPSYQDVMLPVLEAIAAGHERIDSLLPLIQTRFELSDEQMEELLPSGKQATISNRAHWARNYMKHAGLVAPLRRGHYHATDAGRQLLAENLPRIDNTVLQRFQAFRDWRNKDRSTPTADGVSPATPQETPEDQIDAAWRELDRVLVDDLLEQVLALTPARFERLIVELLIAMGYGDGRAEMGQALGRSGDGGIDGVVNEDKLGLDAVYIQAKRYAPDNTVSRPAVQGFVGSMTGESATKGVFVTTSGFSAQARDYVTRVQQRVVLIDGARLARLMIDHGVGVVAEKIYVLHKIDENFFGDA